MPSRFHRFILVMLMAAFAACRSAKCKAQAPWDVPPAYWQPVTCYCSQPGQIQYQVASSTAATPQATNFSPACCGCCCCGRPDNSNGSGNDPPAGNDTPPDPNNHSNDGSAGDKDEPGSNDQAGLASYRYAVQRVKAASFSGDTPVAITGLWHSKFGNISLHRNGNVVSGIIEYNRGGVIDVEGHYELGKLTLMYQNRAQPEIRGKVALHYDSSKGHLVGKSRNSVSGRESEWSLSKR